MKPAHDHTISEIFNVHSAALLLYARQWVDAAGAEDVVQRIFVRLLSSGKLPAEPKTWLFRCVRNEAIGTWRSDRRRRRREESVAGGAPVWFVSKADDPIDAISAQQAMAALPPSQREVVALRIWSGLTLAQVSEVTEMPISSVHHQLNLALSAMRERLESSCKTRNR